MSFRQQASAVLVVICLAWGTGCAGFMPAPESYDYFAAPAPSDAWSPKIGNWQRRARADQRPVARGPRVAVASVPQTAEALPQTAEALPQATEALPQATETLEPQASAPVLAVSQREPDVSPIPLAKPAASTPPLMAAQPEALPSGRDLEAVAMLDVGGDSLRSKYRAFQAHWRRAMVRDLFEWIQLQAREHYVADGIVDHWATLEETLERNGDDCDGLELLVYDTLLSLGFDKSEVFRAVVYRPADLQHHMVTLWFEDAHDPWVIDPTGAMTDRLVRMSELPDWVPLKLFGLHAEFTVGRLHRRVPDAPGPVAQN